MKIREKLMRCFYIEARFVVNEILEYMSLKGCDIIWELVFRLFFIFASNVLVKTRTSIAYLSEKSVNKR